MDRKERLLSRSNRSDRIVEIGAGYDPIAPKSGGWNTHVVDHADRDALIAKYQAADVDLTRIETVDSIWNGGSLHDAMPPDLIGRIHTIVASHVLEHVPDLLGFLQSAQRVATEDGAIAVALPDRRFCFDLFQPPSTTGDVLQAWKEGRTRHSARTAWNQLAYAVKSDGRLAWAPGESGDLAFIDPFDFAQRRIAEHSEAAEAAYVDFHAWHFTPAGFSLTLLELGALGLTDWRVEEIVATETFEFFVFLRRAPLALDDPAALQRQRLALLRRQAAEMREVWDAAEPKPRRLLGWLR